MAPFILTGAPASASNVVHVALRSASDRRLRALPLRASAGSTLEAAGRVQLGSLEGTTASIHTNTTVSIAHDLYSRRNSTQSSSLSPAVRNLRFNQLMRGLEHHQQQQQQRQQQQLASPPYHQPPSLFALSLPRSPALPPRDFYLSSAPASSAALQQAPRSPSRRPPVPLFSRNSTDDMRWQSTTTLSVGRMAGSTVPQDLDALLDLPTSDFDPYSATEPVAPHSDLSASAIVPAFSAVNSMNPLTVSPKDLMKEPDFSAPPSAAFTNLTSPSNFESPDPLDSFETSPIFSTVDGDLGGPDSWYPLFPGVAPESEESPLQPAEEVFAFGPPVAARSPSPLFSLSPSRARIKPGGKKRPAVAAVGPRKRDHPLPPIEVADPADSVAVKRARNTQAARKSRQKKVERVEELERTIERLHRDVEYWKQMALNREMAERGFRADDH
ncbi:MAG: hypothetical protein M1826_000593 [Phylliscum demangeonii]|nr:MAG: hypothetical protein M1826_000593 [Phylliscum demangeonii]